jgi:adenylate cyclase
MDAREFEAAGLYNPKAPHAAERLELLEWLAGRGTSLEQMLAADRAGLITGLAGDLALRPGPRLTAREIAARYTLELDYVLKLSLAIGLPPPSPDTPVYTEDDAGMFAASIGGAALFGESAALRFTRVVGSSLARIAEAAVSLFQVHVERPLQESGETELGLAQQNLRGIASLEIVRNMLQMLFSAHVETAIRRFREARPRRADTARMAVGFVDLVGFTTLSRNVSALELAAVVERFEEAAYDIASARDGRVVKLVGDEVMFVTRDPVAACDIALSLVERFAGDASVTPRGGLAFGELLVRGGDYYGPVVNLAARVAQIAVPNELLVTSAVAHAASGAALRFEPAGKRMLKGFDEPVALDTVARGAGTT